MLQPFVAKCHALRCAGLSPGAAEGGDNCNISYSAFHFEFDNLQKEGMKKGVPGASSVSVGVDAMVGGNPLTSATKVKK